MYQELLLPRVHKNQLEWIYITVITFEHHFGEDKFTTFNILNLSSL